jgi:hypothetical protein
MRAKDLAMTARRPRYRGAIAACFADDRHCHTLAAELNLNARLREPAVRRIVERLCGLSPAAIHELACYIDELERNDVLDQDRRIQHRVAQ